MHRNASGHYVTTALGAVDTARRLVTLFDDDTRRIQPSGRRAAAGIARVLTGQRRNRVFSYHASLAILNEGGEAL